MAADFPNNPVIGESFTVDGRAWTWNGSVWNAVTTAPAVTFTASDTAPGSPVVGSGWFDTTSGQFFIYYDSGWVEFGTNLTGPTGPQGPAGTDGIDGEPYGNIDGGKANSNFASTITTVTGGNAGSF
jgi:hypothetical protein